MRYILSGLIMIISFGKGEQPAVPFYDHLVVTEGCAKLNEEFVLTFSFKALMELPETKVIFEIPKGVEIIEGIPSQIINPHLDDSIPVSLRLKITHIGPFKITVHTIIAPSDTIFFFQHFAEVLYIICKADTAFYDNNATDGIEYNLISDEVLGEKPSEPPSRAEYTISGAVRYYNKLTSTLEPLTVY